MRLLLFQTFLIIIVFFSTGCSQKNASSRSAGKVQQGSKNFVDLGSDNGGDSESLEEGNEVQSTDSLLNDESLEGMGLAELKSNYRSRQKDLEASEFDLALNNEVGEALCLRFQKLKEECVVAEQLIQSESGFGCSEETRGAPSSDVFSVKLIDAQGSPLSSVDGQFILVVNTNYYSSPFGVSSNQLEFQYRGSGEVDAPQIKEIYEIQLRRADEDNAAIFDGAGKEMPNKEEIGLQLSYGDVLLTEGRLLDVDNTGFKGYRYRADLAKILSLASSNECKVRQAEIDGIKDQARGALEAQQYYNQKNALSSVSSVSSMSEEELKQGIIGLQDKILDLEPTLESSRDKLFLLTNELKAVQSLGCHANEPILNVSIELLGESKDPKLLGDNFDSCPILQPVGPGSILNVEMGPSLTFSIDQLKSPLGAGAWTGSVSEQALVGDVQYFRISKQGITIEDSGPNCESAFLGFGGQCPRTCIETEIYEVTGARVSVETPSVSGFVIYENSSIDKVFASKQFSSSAVIDWEDSLTEGEPWLNFMYDTNCEESR